MKPNIDFTECLKDSPKFRCSLEEAENDIEKLEQRLDKVMKLCGAMIDAGKTYNNTNGNLIHGIKDLSKYFQQDGVVSAALDRFSQALVEVHKFNAILMEQAKKSVMKNINSFIKKDIKKVKETRKHFEKISFDMDQALVKHSQAQKSKLQECEETQNVLTAMRSCFWHTSLDYVFQINVLHSKKRFDILHSMMSFIHAQNTYFHQGHDLFQDLEPELKTIATQLEELNNKAVLERKRMEERHSLVQDRVVNNGAGSYTTNENGDIGMEGYLFKRTSNAFKTWVRRWFMIHASKLVYRKRINDQLTIMEDDLRLCSVKPAQEIDRRFCLEVVSPVRSHMLQADSEAECQAWVAAIQAGVSKAYRDASRDRPTLEEHLSNMNHSDGGASDDMHRNKVANRLQQVLLVRGNEECSDCGAPEPRWASMNLGISLCIECSGIHRSFGVHLSKVRSLTLDAWEPEHLKVMAELGNKVVASIYEGTVDESIAKRATPQCTREIREAWIRSKYVNKSFVRNFSERAQSKSGTAKHWSVYRRRRKAATPTRPMDSPNANHVPVDNAAVAATDGDAGNMAQGASHDSGLGGDNTTHDVIVFGSSMLNTHTPSELVCSEDSEGSDIEPDETSTTSLEDVSMLNPDTVLYRAAEARNVPIMLEALAQGAAINWANVNDQRRTPLMMAVKSGSLAACEFLLLNGAKVDQKDATSQTALHHATLMGHTGQVCQFLKRGANLHAVDDEGNDPLAIAIKIANADIVTLLRLAKLNEEMKESEGCYGISDPCLRPSGRSKLTRLTQFSSWMR